MSASVVQAAIKDSLAALERAGDIVVTTTTSSQVTEYICKAVCEVSPNLLSETEYSAIISAAMNTWSGYHLDDNEFELFIGMSRESLKAAIDKLRRPR